VSETPLDGRVQPLVYADPDRRLWLALPGTSTAYSLTDPGVRLSALSPGKDRLCYTTDTGQTKLLAWRSTGAALGFETWDLGHLTAPPRWSPDGKRLYFHDDAGRSRVLDSDGQVLLLPFDAGSAPGWSFDGQYLAYLDGGVLRVAATSGERWRIAANVETFRWSDQSSLLAFQSNEQVLNFWEPISPETRRVYIFDAASWTSAQIAPRGSILYWLPGGRILAIRRLDVAPMASGGPEYSEALLVGEPGQTGLLEVKSSPAAWDDRLIANPIEGSRILGPWRIMPGLKGLETIVPAPGLPVSWTADGNQALVIEERGKEQQLYLFDRSSGARRELLVHTGSPGNWEHGLEAQISPLGRWGLFWTDEGAKTRKMWLARLPDGGKQELPVLSRATFSLDENWLLGLSDRGWLVYDLQKHRESLLPSAPGLPAFWLPIVN
jgi:dipeptidyl aminopeptidase/acylaminoacyl peptidase